MFNFPNILVLSVSIMLLDVAKKKSNTKDYSIPHTYQAKKKKKTFIQYVILKDINPICCPIKTVNISTFFEELVRLFYKSSRSHSLGGPIYQILCGSMEVSWHQELFCALE